MASDARRRAARIVGRTALGAVLGTFGVLELTAPAQWSGFVPPAIARLVPAVPLVLAHGWFLLVLGTAIMADFLPGIATWAAVAVLCEVIGGLIWTSGFSTTIVRDFGLLGLAVAAALSDALDTGSETAAGSRTGRNGNIAGRRSVPETQPHA